VLVNNSEWRKLTQIQKKERLLRAYIQNLELQFINSGFDKNYESRIKEAKFILDLLRERVA
jgi:hypothetical protein